MAPSSDYTSIPSTGKLKLKGVKDSKVDKKKSKKKKPRPEDNGGVEEEFKDNSVVLKSLEDEDATMRKEKNREVAIVDGQTIEPDIGVEDEVGDERVKTEAERKFQEHRRKRVCLVQKSRSCCEKILTVVGYSWTSDSSERASLHTSRESSS